MRRLYLFLLAGSLLFFACQNEVTDRTRVQQGNFVATITETGELQALRSRVIIAPNYNWNYGRPTIVALEEEGTQVQQGDWVGQIDTTGVIRYMMEQENRLAIEKANLQQMVVEQETAMKNLEATLQEQEAALRQAEIDTQRTRFEAPTQQEISRLRLRMARIDYQKAKQNIEHTKVIQEQDLLIQRNRIRQIQSEINEAKRTIETYRLTAPADGMVVYKEHGRRRDREKVKVGDEIRRGSALIGLPDLSEMKALAAINETDIGKIRLDQKVRVRLDAFPDQMFEGKIIYIGKISQEEEDESNVKVFEFEVLLENATSICRPGMTVSCEVIVAEYDNAMFVDNSYIVERDNQYYVILQRGGQKEWVPVTLGARNNETVVVQGDLQAGEKLVDPTKEEQA